MNAMNMIRTFAAATAAAALLAGAPAMAQAPELAGAPGAERLFSGQVQAPQVEVQVQEFRQAGDVRGRIDVSLVGLRVEAAQDALRSRGFSHTRSISDGGRQYDLWASGRDCVGFTSYNGRVTDVRDFRNAECGSDGGWGGGQGGGWGGGGRFDLRDLEGLRVNSAKDVLRSEGFRHERNVRIDGRQYDLWSSGRRCVGFASYNGRVSDARNFRDECGRTGGPGNGGGWGGGRFNPRELEGLDVRRAQEALRWDGFVHARNVRIDGRQYDLWYSREQRNGCVGFASYNGRVTDARAFNERDCY
jgi:hypothetical protein